MFKNCVVIVAAGKGKRMGKNISKQFIEIKEKPILYYTLKTFSECDYIDKIFLVISKDDRAYCEKEVIYKYKFKNITIVEGGAERQESVYNGLKAINNCDIVLIHDGARPFVSEKIIKEGIEYAKIYGASACGVKPKDTIKVKDFNSFSVETPDRDTLIAVQTPQCFKYNLIMQLHNRLKKDEISVTDDTMILEQYGQKVFLYEGDYNNIKITTPEDIFLAEYLMKN
jgi:2-C-methyl-D-erythritol 4-phosphate cytidylyltransferase